MRFGGLRGGSVTVTRSSAHVHALSYVPGVQLSGRLPMGVLLRNHGGAGVLQVGGSAAAAGRLRFAGGGRITGTLEGRSLSVNASARVRLARGGAGSTQAQPLRPPLGPLARVP